MDKFFALPVEKQQAIINAAMGVFARSGYKKAFVSDIAREAGISKAMVFFYFGNKKNLYLYMIEVALATVEAAYAAILDLTVTDFFDRLLQITQTKLSVMKERPALLYFVTSLFFETDEEVAEEIQAVLQSGTDMRQTMALTDIDRQKFKDGIDPGLVEQILVKYAEGYVSSLPRGKEYSLDDLSDEFHRGVALMKNNFYKEEYL